MSSVDDVHAKALAVLGEIQKHLIAAAADAGSAKVEQQRISELHAEIQTLALAAKTQINDVQTVVATKSDHIENARLHADKVRADLDRTLTLASQQATEAEGLKTRAETAADSLAELLAESKANKGAVDINIAAIAEAKGIAEESAGTLKKLGDKATTVQQQLSVYETRLAELEKQCVNQLKLITDLLPGATSAGLASAFDKRRATFLDPAKKWQWIFIGSVVTLVLLALTGLWHVFTDHAVISYDELLRLWLARLPVAGALIWLALYASRESALAKRLEEDYGYKSAIASSFLGFHKQMTEIGTAAESNLPLQRLCTDTLATIASPPGRIYEKHALTVTPGDELKEAVKSLVPKPL